MKYKSNLSLIMTRAAAASGILTLLFFGIFHWLHWGWLEAAAITCITIFYHFAMRLVVGTVIPNSFDYRNIWFQPKVFEARLYRFLQVKRWKDRIPTYNPQLFSLAENSLEQIVNHICQAEVVHLTIILLSFVPLLFSLIWQNLFVFLITSILAALVDTVFVILQRYNRPRLVRLMEKQQSRRCKSL